MVPSPKSSLSKNVKKGDLKLQKENDAFTLKANLTKCLVSKKVSDYISKKVSGRKYVRFSIPFVRHF